jgi:hypothetical protein
LTTPTYSWSGTGAGRRTDCAPALVAFRNLCRPGVFVLLLYDALRANRLHELLSLEESQQRFDDAVRQAHAVGNLAAGKTATEAHGLEREVD